MRPKRMIAILLGLLLFLMVICGTGTWILFSYVSSGYEVAGKQVFYRYFDNLKWKVERRLVRSADPATLTTLPWSGGLYAKDNNQVYCEGVSLSNADPATFQVLDWREKYSRDAHQAYWASIAFSQDPDNLELLGRAYARDSSHVYFGRNAIEGADPATFEVDDTATSHAHDRNHRYNMGRRVPVAD